MTEADEEPIDDESNKERRNLTPSERAEAERRWAQRRRDESALAWARFQEDTAAYAARYPDDLTIKEFEAFLNVGPDVLVPPDPEPWVWPEPVEPRSKVHHRVDDGLWRAFRVFEDLRRHARIIAQRGSDAEVAHAKTMIDQLHAAVLGDDARRREFVRLLREAAKDVAEGTPSAEAAIVLRARAGRRCDEAFFSLSEAMIVQEISTLRGEGIHSAARLSRMARAFIDGPRNTVEEVAERYRKASKRARTRQK